MSAGGRWCAWAGIVGLLFLPLWGGCSEPAPPALVGERVTITFEEGAEEVLCAGSLRFIDAYVDALLEVAGVEVDAGWMIPVEVVLETEALCENAHAHGCFISRSRTVALRLISTGVDPIFGALFHELAHAVAYEAWGTSNRFFTEGFAEWAGGGKVPWGYAPMPMPVEPLIHGEIAGSEAYIAAAAFTGFLIDHSGIEAFAEVYRKAARRSEGGLSRLVDRVYGQDLATLEAEHLRASRACFSKIDACGLDVFGPAVDVDAEGGLERTILATCTNPDFVGVNGIGWTIVPFRVDGGFYRLTSSQILHLTRCDACEAPFRVDVGGRGGERLDLAAGIYALRIPTQTRGDIRVTLSLAPEAPEQTAP